MWLPERGGVGGWGELDEGGQKIQKSSYKVSKFWDDYILPCALENESGGKEAGGDPEG